MANGDFPLASTPAPVPVHVQGPHTVPPSVHSQKKNIVVIGGSFVGTKSAELLATRLHTTHNIILIEKNSHFQYLFAFPRFAVVPGHEHKAFIPYTAMFSSISIRRPCVCAREAGNCPCPREGENERPVQVLQGLATAIREDCVVVRKKSESEDEKEEVVEVPYEYLVIATGTKLSPPGSLHTEGKMDGVEYFRAYQEQVRRSKRIVVVGGGAVGIQMATDIADHYSSHSKHVTLVHSRPRLMHRFHPKLHSIIAQRCSELGVEVILGERVNVPEGGFPVPRVAEKGKGGKAVVEEEQEEFEVELGSGKKVKADFVIFATGQTPNSSIISTFSPSSLTPPSPPCPCPSTYPASPSPSLPPPTQNQFISIHRTLQLADSPKPTTHCKPKYPHIFALGDVAHTTHHKAAKPAYAQARVLVENVARLVQAKAKERALKDRAGCEVSCEVGTHGEADMEDGGCRTCQGEKGVGKNEVEVELKEYEEHPVGIHMSLGLTRNVTFRNPSPPASFEDEDAIPAICEVHDDGQEDLRIGRVWRQRAPGIEDYWV